MILDWNSFSVRWTYLLAESRLTIEKSDIDTRVAYLVCKGSPFNWICATQMLQVSEDGEPVRMHFNPRSCNSRRDIHDRYLIERAIRTAARK